MVVFVRFIELDREITVNFFTDRTKNIDSRNAGFEDPAVRSAVGGHTRCFQSEAVAVGILDLNLAIMVFGGLCALAIVAISVGSFAGRGGRGHAGIEIVRDERTERTSVRGAVSFGEDDRELPPSGQWLPIQPDRHRETATLPSGGNSGVLDPP